MSNLSNFVKNSADLVGSAKPSILYYPMTRFLSHLMSFDSEKIVSKGSLAVRKMFYPILKVAAPLLSGYPLVVESKNALLGIDEPDKPFEKSDKPVIICPNHGFKDDVLASIVSYRHAYVLFGSLPMFFNTFDGVGAYVNGVVLCNRKVKESKITSLSGAIKVLNNGTDMIVFPEGVWNKTAEKLMLDLWPGAYRIAKETGSEIVPVIHYLPDPHKKYAGNVIHTVIADPISIEGLTEKEFLIKLRDIMATWYYLMMEKYGKTTRKELLGEFENSEDAWEAYMEEHTGCVKYYDCEIERCADYRRSDVVRPEEAWKSVAEIKNVNTNNASHIAFANEVVRRELKRDFQRRY